MKVYYVNDTSSWDDLGVVHGGCVALNANLKRRITEAGHEIVAVCKRPYGPTVEDLEKCDWVIVNGEGTFRDELIGHEPGRHDRLFNGLSLAKKMGKRVYLTNTVWCKMTDRWNKLLRELDGISVREPASANAIYASCGRMPEIHPDEAYFVPVMEAKPRFPRKFVGNLYAGNTKEHLTEGNPIFRDFYPLGLMQHTWSHVVSTLQSCGELYVTGQHHGIYAASKAGCPFAAVRVNTHKISALFDWANVRIPLATSKLELLDLIEWAQTDEAAEQFANLSSFLEQQSPWPIPTA